MMRSLSHQERGKKNNRHFIRDGLPLENCSRFVDLAHRKNSQEFFQATVLSGAGWRFVALATNTL
jgi:hypothetical protein